MLKERSLSIENKVNNMLTTSKYGGSNLLLNDIKNVCEIQGNVLCK